jgi:hypothetical protein
MLDPEEINADPQPYLEDHLLPGLQRRKLVPHSVQPLPELLTGEAHRMTVDVSAGAAAWVQSCVVNPEHFSGHVGSVYHSGSRTTFNTSVADPDPGSDAFLTPGKNLFRIPDPKPIFKGA